VWAGGDRLGGAFEQRSFGDGEVFALGVEELAGRAEGVKERLPVFLVLPAVDRQEPVGPSGVAPSAA
jgi:hypothetical protein